MDGARTAANNAKTKKSLFRGVLDGFRSTVAGSGGSASASAAQRPDLGIEETLGSDHFQVTKTVRHGFPLEPTALAYDPVQNLLAIGTRSGSIRILGQPGVDCHVKHEAEVSVLQLMFLVNEGALVSACADDQLHLWSLRQKKPEIIHSLKFQRERITFCHLPFQSKWLYVGTDRGNVHVINLESFVLSGYVINWNKTIELMRKTHPGPVVHLSDNQMDTNKLLIGYEAGVLALWDLKNRVAEFRYSCTETLRSACWHHEGKQFICSHGDGSLTIWNAKSPQQPQSAMMPHAKLRDGKPEPCKPITKVELRTNRNSEPYIIFSGGMPVVPGEKSSKLSSTVTIMHGTNTTVLELEHGVIDFITICSTPWNNDFQDPFAAAILLQSDFVMVDLTSPNYPCFENPYPMDLHESPVTACVYFADCPPDLIPAFYSVGCRQKKTGYSEKEWPIKGGSWGSPTCSYPEIIVTGHADGSLKFWDASAAMLQVLYKMKTAKLFDDGRSGLPSGSSASSPSAVQLIHLCVESRLLCVAGSSHVAVFSFSRQESQIECPVIEVSIVYEVLDGSDSPETEFSSGPGRPSTDKDPGLSSGQGATGPGPGTQQTQGSNEKEGHQQTLLKLKSGPRKWSSGYQPELCCLLTYIDNDPPPPITSLSLNSKYGLLAFGNDFGLAIVDIVQKSCLISIGSPDLYGSLDPYSRASRSPKQKNYPQGFEGATSQVSITEDFKPPVVDQRTYSVGQNNEILRRGSSSTFAIYKADSFSRSQSSSTSSLENVNKEAVHCLAFNDVYARKSDSFFSPCLWAGTSLGTVLVMSLSFSEDPELRKTDPVVLMPTGTIFRLKGAVIMISFLDSNGILIPSPGDQWRDRNREELAKEKKAYCSKTDGQQSSSNLKPRISPSSSGDLSPEQQYAVLCSEKQARVVAIPSQICVFKVKITETSSVVKADVVLLKDNFCLACFLLNGHVMTFSLPSLKPLLDVDYIPLPDTRVTKTFCFSSNCHVLYFCSASELQKLTLSAEMSESLNEMLSEIFIPCNMPEAPKQGFFKNLFNVGSASLDREELFGEGSGKAPKGVVKYTSGMSQLQEGAGVATSEIGRAKMLALERGEKLGELEEKTERLKMDSELYMHSAQQLKNKYKDKKWYQL